MGACLISVFGWYDDEGLDLERAPCTLGIMLRYVRGLLPDARAGVQRPLHWYREIVSSTIDRSAGLLVIAALSARNTTNCSCTLHGA